MSDDPRLNMFLRQWEADVAEGKTVRALHDRLDDHVENDKKDMQGIRKEIQNLRESRAFDKGQRSAEGTGRFNIVPPGSALPPAVLPPGTAPIPTPPPFTPFAPVQVTIDTGHREKRTIPPIVSKLASSKPAQLILTAIGFSLLGWISHHFGLGGKTDPPPVHTVEIQEK